MIHTHCKRLFVAVCFTTLVLPLTAWSEAPVVDESDNFAITAQQEANQAPLVNSKYDESQYDETQGENTRIASAQNNNYPDDRARDDEPALVKEETTDANRNPASKFNDNARLIDKVQNLQQEIQELRGQLEVLTHDLKLLQQQQIAFYKDLDNRLAAVPGKSAQSKPPTDLNAAPNVAAPKVAVTNSPPVVATPKLASATSTVKPVIAVSRMNPADEQIRYLAAYELVKNKRYEEALNAMQTFVQQYPRGGYTANAEYWLGELYLIKKDYSKSIEHFEVVLQQFPSSSKSAASMLKDGYAYAALGDNQTAKKRFQQVVTTYPDTPSAQLANSKLQTINAI